MNTIQLIIIIAIFVAPALKQVYDKAKERAEVERRKRDVERARTETLRTGRGSAQQSRATPQTRPSPEAAVAAAERSRIQQLESERQRRLNELRRVAQQRAQQTRTQGAPGRAPQPQQRQQTRPAQPQRRQPAQQRRQQVPQKAPTLASSPRREEAEAMAGADRGITSVIGLTSTGTVTSGRHPGVRLGKLAVDDLRRAVVLTEVLGPPVSLRERHLDTADRFA